MKANELMVGDWVCYDKPNGYITQVDSIRHCGNETLGYEYFVDCVRDKIDPLYIEFPKDSFNVEILHPISLTKKILEKNGILKDNENLFWLTEEGCYIAYWINERILEIQNLTNKNEITLFCYCAHQLQHALKLCGIEKNIEL